MVCTVRSYLSPKSFVISVYKSIKVAKISCHTRGSFSQSLLRGRKRGHLLNTYYVLADVISLRLLVLKFGYTLESPRELKNTDAWSPPSDIMI